MKLRSRLLARKFPPGRALEVWQSSSASVSCWASQNKGEGSWNIVRSLLFSVNASILFDQDYLFRDLEDCVTNITNKEVGPSNSGYILTSFYKHKIFCDGVLNVNMNLLTCMT